MPEAHEVFFLGPFKNFFICRNDDSGMERRAAGLGSPLHTPN